MTEPFTLKDHGIIVGEIHPPARSTNTPSATRRTPASPRTVRWSGTVGRPEIQRFSGALHGQYAAKGIFITTSDLSRDAHDYVSKIGSKIVLIDGERLAESRLNLLRTSFAPGLVMDFSQFVIAFFPSQRRGKFSAMNASMCWAFRIHIETLQKRSIIQRPRPEIFLGFSHRLDRTLADLSEPSCGSAFLPNVNINLLRRSGSHLLRVDFKNCTMEEMARSHK
jgi:Restriction endonuclease